MKPETQNPKFTCSKFHMGKQNIKACSNNDLELVKAAAWAWYQHGSNSEGKLMATQEFDVTRTRRAPRPTRYKLEATRNNSNNNNNNMMERSNKYTLLDAYEIESISKRLDHLVESSGIKFYQELLKIDTNVVDDRSKNKRSGSSKLKRFMLRRGVVCGKNHDVDEMAFEPKSHAVIKTVKW